MEKNINVPNALAVLRLFLAPIIMYFILNSMNNTALVFFIIALATDFLDGMISRKYNIVTRFGEVLDPISDKILFGFTLFAILIKNDYLFWILVFGIFVVIYTIGYIIFIDKNMKVRNLGRFFIIVDALLVVLMIYGFVNDLIFFMFLISLTIPAVMYLIEMIKK